MKTYIYLLIALMLPWSLLAQAAESPINDDWSNSRYHVHGDGTVTDTVTGLMWMQCSLGQGYDYDAGNCSSSAATRGYSWPAALEAAEAHSLADHTDWRLPNIRELASLVARDGADPAINNAVFSAISANYWSASLSAADSTQAWLVHFASGADVAADHRDSNHVRLVRSVR